MLSAGEVDYLVQATRSSVKRFGGNGPTLSHLAVVLSDKWPDQFLEVFGEDGPDDVKGLLPDRPRGAEQRDVQRSHQVRRWNTVT